MVPLGSLRTRLIYFTVGSMLLTIILLSLLYLFNPPLDYQDFLRIFQQVLPIFIGFLLSAISYATGAKHTGSIEQERYKLLTVILDFSFIIYWVGVLAVTSVFLYSHILEETSRLYGWLIFRAKRSSLVKLFSFGMARRHI